MHNPFFLSALITPTPITATKVLVNIWAIATRTQPIWRILTRTIHSRAGFTHSKLTKPIIYLKKEINLKKIRFEENEVGSIVAYLDCMRLNFMDYLKDAKQGILKTSDQAIKWSFNYEVFVPNTNTEQQQNQTEPTMKPTKNLKTRPSAELDCDAEEFLLNLNIFSSSLHDPTKSARSTINLFSSKEIDALNTDENLEFDLSSLAGMSQTSSVKKSVRRRTRKGTSVRRVSTDGSANEAKRTRRRKRRERKVNDFYCISFDNELSETSDSSASSHVSSLASEVYDDDELTATSLSSAATLNNESDSLSSTPNDNSRQLLVDFLFNNENNRDTFLNTDLNNFLNALDEYFIKANIKINNKKKKLDKRRMKREEEELNALCDQILDIYNEIFKR